MICTATKQRNLVTAQDAGVEEVAATVCPPRPVAPAVEPGPSITFQTPQGLGIMDPGSLLRAGRGDERGVAPVAGDHCERTANILDSYKVWKSEDKQ